MKPSYEDITEANPRLKNRPKEDVEKLLDTIVSKGYTWDDKKKYFYNEKLGMHVRTQGLDLFDPERFEKAFKTWSNPEYTEAAITAHKWIPIFLIIFFLDLILGWLFMPIKIWIASLIFVGLLISLKKDAFKMIREKIKS
ncbi:hypothetical protein L6248_00900 [Candidatus Parcubacteria bacterium]|nr:hypothetical protein [Candidatus Parcubacteria bacterium]MCG2697760.1 hypothetical protein [Candidatus Parcubacteria bacterium]